MVIFHGIAHYIYIMFMVYTTCAMLYRLSDNYIRYDLNMPKSLPKRKGGPQDFAQDSPLTVQGHFQARLVGKHI